MDAKRVLWQEEPNKIFRKIREEIPVARFMHYRDYLKNVYQFLKPQIAGYSYLKFATEMGFGQQNNFLRLIINGQRKLTVKSAEKIADAFLFGKTERRYWLALVQFCNARRASERDDHSKTLMNLKPKLLPETIDRARLTYFSEWHHSVIRELTARDDFEMDPKWIQAKIAFPLRVEEITQSLELLTKLGLIYYDGKSKRYKRSSETLDTGADARGLAFMTYHQKMIDVAKLAVPFVSREKREIQAATIYISEEKLIELKKKVRQLFDEAISMDLSEGGGEHEVVQINMQMFPFTKSDNP